MPLRPFLRAVFKRPGNGHPDWESIKRRIEGAVERGDMTREEADAKYREIKQRMAGHHRR